MNRYEMVVLGGDGRRWRYDALIVDAMLRLRDGLSVQWHPGINYGRLELAGVEIPYEGLLADAFIVLHAESREFKVVDFQDAPTGGPAYQLQHAAGFRGAVLTMFHRPRVEKIYGSHAHLIIPGWFLDQAPELTRQSREFADEVRRGELDQRLHFRGTIDLCRDGQVYNPERRLVARILAEKYPDEVLMTDEYLPRSEWFIAAARHRVNLALPGHPWCYREFELMSLGLPFISYPWHTHVEAGALPVPYAHYVPTAEVSRHPDGHAIDSEHAADVIIAAHRQILQRPAWLEAIGRRARRWYDRMLAPEVIAAGLLDVLALGEW